MPFPGTNTSGYKYASRFTSKEERSKQYNMFKNSSPKKQAKLLEKQERSNNSFNTPLKTSHNAPSPHNNNSNLNYSRTKYIPNELKVTKKPICNSLDKFINKNNFIKIIQSNFNDLISNKALDLLWDSLNEELSKKENDLFKTIKEIKTYIDISNKIYEICVKVNNYTKQIIEIRANIHKENYKECSNKVDMHESISKKYYQPININNLHKWRFVGSEENPDYLFNLVTTGKKTATSYLYDEKYTLKENEYSILTNCTGNKNLLVKSTHFRICKFCEVTEEHAIAEGEGDLSLTYWKNIHKHFFSEILAQQNQEFNENIKVVCESFLVERIL